MEKTDAVRREKLQPYAPPRMRVYGDVRDITLTMSGGTTRDSSPNPPNRISA